MLLFFQRILRALASPLSPWIIIVASVALCTPSLSVGLYADDWIQQLLLQNDTGIEGYRSRPFSLFTFISGDPEQTQPLIQRGLFAWWTDPEAKISFFRPLASASHWLDTKLGLGSGPVGAAAWMHAHNLAWLAASLASLWLVYRDLLRPPNSTSSSPRPRSIAGHSLAALALLLYALDDTRGPVVGWVANRNALMSVTFGLLTLWTHHHASEKKDTRWYGAAIVLWLLALLSGEFSAGAMGYLLAYCLCVSKGTWLSRLRGFFPYLALFVAVIGCSRAWGYGVQGSGAYISPFAAPFEFLSATVIRGPMLLISQLALPWSSVSLLASYTWPQATLWIVLFGLLGVWGIGTVAWPVMRDDPRRRSFVLGMFLSCIPVCAAIPADRVLGFVGVGAMAWVACFLHDATQARSPLSRSQKAVLALWCCCHLVLGPLFLAPRSRSMEVAGEPLIQASQSLPESDALEQEFIFLINPPTDAHATYILAHRAYLGQALPRQLHWLGVAATEMTLERLDEKRLKVRQKGGYVAKMSEQMFRDPRSRPFEIGQSFEFEEFNLTVLSLTPDQRPLEVLYHFKRPLEDPRYRWARWEKTGFREVSAPAAGQSSQLPAFTLLDSIQTGAPQDSPDT